MGGAGMARLHRLPFCLDHSPEKGTCIDSLMDLRTGFHPLRRLHHLSFFGPQKLKRQQFKRLLSKTALREHSNLLQVRNHILATSAHSTELMQLSNMIRTTTGFPLTTARTLRLLVDGEQTFTAILEAVANATHHIHLEYYIYDPDEIGMTLRDLLIAKAEEGVKVRLLVDGIGSSRLKKAFIYPLIQAGAEFAFFHKPHIIPIDETARQFANTPQDRHMRRTCRVYGRT